MVKTCRSQNIWGLYKDHVVGGSKLWVGLRVFHTAAAPLLNFDGLISKVAASEKGTILFDGRENQCSHLPGLTRRAGQARQAGHRLANALAALVALVHVIAMQIFLLF